LNGNDLLHKNLLEQCIYCISTQYSKRGHNKLAVSEDHVVNINQRVSVTRLLKLCLSPHYYNYNVSREKRALCYSVYTFFQLYWYTEIIVLL
jgi:hypothetical protein